MSEPASEPRAAVVTRLRAAGCVFAEDEADLLLAAAPTPADLTGMVDRRADGQPLEVILGWARFHGRRVTVDPAVFVPRRRTEFLIDQAITLATPTAVVVDLCCGTGAVGAAVATELGHAELYACDIDPTAVRCAHRNITELDGHALLGDLYDPLPRTLRGRVDLLIANAPYVPSDAIATMPPEARDHEPRTALDGGPDGTDVQRRVATGAPPWLTPGGHLLIETSRQQARHTAETVAASGLTPRVTHSEDLDATVVLGRRRAT